MWRPWIQEVDPTWGLALRMGWLGRPPKQAAWEEVSLLVRLPTSVTSPRPGVPTPSS